MTTVAKSDFVASYIANYYAARSSTGPVAHGGVIAGARTPADIRRVWDEAESLWKAYADEARRREVEYWAVAASLDARHDPAREVGHGGHTAGSNGVHAANGTTGLPGGS